MFHFDGIRTLQELEISRQRVFVRADLDCPIGAPDAALEYNKITALAPTVSYLLEREARIVIGAHRGAPDDDQSLEPCAAQLAGLLGVEVYMPDDINGPMSKKLLTELRAGQVVVYENLNHQPGERKADEAFARRMAEGVEIYVGDCLTTADSQASLKKLPRLCPERAMGLNLERELVASNRLSRQHEETTVIYLGGSFAHHADLLRSVLRPGLTVCAGGQLAATLLKAQNRDIGSSSFESELLGEARTWLEKADREDTRVLLPVDARTAGDDPGTKLDRLGNSRLLDIGPETEKLYAEALSGAQSAVILQSFCRSEHFERDQGLLAGTRAVVQALVRSPIYSVVCSSRELPISSLLDSEELGRIGFVSTAGQGFEDALCGRFLGAVEALRIG